MSAGHEQSDATAPPMPGFDWAGLMRAGIGGLRLTPRDFWALTPAELWLMLDPHDSPRPLARHRLNELMRAFPDYAPRDDGDPNS